MTPVHCPSWLETWRFCGRSGYWKFIWKWTFLLDGGAVVLEVGPQALDVGFEGAVDEHSGGGRRSGVQQAARRGLSGGFWQPDQQADFGLLSQPGADVALDDFTRRWRRVTVGRGFGGLGPVLGLENDGEGQGE